MNGLNANIKGTVGELNIFASIFKFNFWFKGGKILRNLYLFKENGETTEVDLVYITKKGIFVFESKNYSGTVKGYKDDLMWEVEYKNGTSYPFYNPIRQNETHIRCLRSIVGDDIPIYSIVVFSNEARLYLPVSHNAFLYTILLGKLPFILKEIWRNNPTKIKKRDVKNIYLTLLPFTQVSNEVKQEHIENINKKYRDNEINSDKIIEVDKKEKY